MARGCNGRLKKTGRKQKDRRTWRDFAEKAKTHKGL
jgi:hypothetical protein